jgi:hypothetical protein
MRLLEAQRMAAEAMRAVRPVAMRATRRIPQEDVSTRSFRSTSPPVIDQGTAGMSAERGTPRKRRDDRPGREAVTL